MIKSGTESPAQRNEIRKSREQLLWGIFREEHHETIEQLPLTLYRQLNLVKELDGEASTLEPQIGKALQIYLHRRAKIAKQTGTSLLAPNSQFDKTGQEICNELLPTSELLGQLATLSEDVLRIAEEKVNLAIAAHDSVERHIRLLDQAINDQEMILNGTMTAGTAANPVILPDLSVSRWVKPARNQNTLSDSEGDKKTGKEQVVDVPQSPDKEAPQKNKSRPKSRRKTELNQDTLKFVVPFTGTTGGEMGDDREEKRYCYCDGVSFGEMIACDDPRCQREWFHLECVGLSIPPEGEWYCRDCLKSSSRKRKRR